MNTPLNLKQQAIMGFLSSLANGGLPIGCAISGCVVIFKR